jgi:RimJ/RimL family protein N-acetyltransferase
VADLTPPEILLETERLFLRRFEAQDARLLFELDSDPEVMRFISNGQATPLTQIEQEILPRVLSYYSRVPPEGVWAAHLRAAGEFVGWFHLRSDKIEPEEMELGYRLKKTAWGRGLATEGSQALIRKGFCEWHYEKICARTLRVNAASRRVMEKLGMSAEAEFSFPAAVVANFPPEERPAVKYGITRPQFLSRSKAEAGEAAQ